MTASRPHVRHGFGCVRPCLHGPTSLPEFIATVFGAVELERHVFAPDKFHVELQVGDSVLVVEAGGQTAGSEPPRNATYVYVPDVDAVHARALEKGAASVMPPTDKPYRERQCGFVDAGGNTWWVSTYR